MIKPPFSMSKFMSEEDLHKTAHQYYRQACEEHEAYIELINKVVEVLARELHINSNPPSLFNALGWKQWAIDQAKEQSND